METKFVTDLSENPGHHDSPTPEDEATWPITHAFFNEYGLMDHQLRSYNNFITATIPEIIEKNNIVEVNVNDQRYIVEFGEVFIERPVYKEIDEKIREVSPKECIDRNITYQAHIYIDVEYETPLGDRKIVPRVDFGAIPVMVKSELCNLFPIRYDKVALADLKEDIYDVGGYFIIKGSPKTIVGQERTAFNKTYVFTNRKKKPTFNIYSEVRSTALSGAHSTTTSVGMLKSYVSVVVPYIEMSSIPLGVMFRALGAKDEKDIISYIVSDDDPDKKHILELLLPSLEQSWECSSQEKALHYIGRRGKKFMGDKVEEEKEPDTEEAKTKRQKKQKQTRDDAISYARHLVTREYLPHLGVGEESLTKKRYYLGYMVYKLLMVHMNKRIPEGRDHFANKRVATAGVLLAQQFYN